MSARQLLGGYLFAYLWVLGLALGALPLLMLHNLTGGRWGLAIRAPLAAAASTLPLLALMFVPIALGLEQLFGWWLDAGADGVPRGYLNVPFFIGRAVLYFIVWTGLAVLLTRARNGTPARLQRLSAAGLIVYGLTVSFASFDWIMALVPRWRSSGLGLLVIGGQMLAAIAFAIAVAMRDGKPSAQQRHDLGNLLLAFVMLWAYLAFAQYLIIWIGNLPTDITWYVPRVQTNWRTLGVALAALLFALPFCALLSRRAKRGPRSLAAIAWLVVAMSAVNAFWLVVPSLRPGGFDLRLSDVALFASVAAAWFWFFRRRHGAFAQQGECDART